MSAAHSTSIEIDGDTYFVRRSFDLMRRAEQAFGPLHSLDQKLRQMAMPAADLSRLYRILLEETPDKPPPATIEKHIFEAGIAMCSKDVAVVILQLFAGHKQCLAWLEAELKSAAEAGKAWEAQNPPMPS